jgi:Mannosylglycerate hydrolase MGH1-like glycoside hydrolase domain
MANTMMTSSEPGRIAEADGGAAWRRWGPYLSERAWGTVREDYSEDGEAWDYFPHDHARSRAYRWNEDGMVGFCDDRQNWCLALALWNGRDPILKERMFGLSGPEGNHGEDVKEYWWYLDATPTHSWNTWRYHYPQREFPYAELIAANRSRGRLEPEYELADTGVFGEDRFWAVEVAYAKAAPEDLLMHIRVTNQGPDEATIHILPTLWFRNTWAWEEPGADGRPSIRAGEGHLAASHRDIGPLTLAYDGAPTPLFCDNETNAERLWGTANRSPYPKDAINDHVVGGRDTVNPERAGTKAALHYVRTVGPGATTEIRVRLASGSVPGETGGAFEACLAARRAEADEFYGKLIPAAATDDEAMVARQALAGMLWSKQFYHYDVERWLQGDPGHQIPPEARTRGRNAAWRHLNNADVISMPDKWEYPWYAAWDLAFHAVALAHVDPSFAKDQLLLMMREWYMHPSGQLPAYEWDFGDVNPPVHAWAALKVFAIDGGADYAFLKRAFHKLLLNFTWWVNRKDTDGMNVFEGGFLGLDNIGPIDRSAMSPVGGRLEQSDGTAWMAMYCLNLWEIALVLAEHDPAYEDMATKFFEHFALIASAAQRLWDDVDGYFYDVLSTAGGTRTPLRVRSVVGLLPLAATTTLGPATAERLPFFAGHMRWFLDHKPELAGVVSAVHERGGTLGRLLSVVGPKQLARVLGVMLDEREILSAYGLRAISRAHREEPFTLRIGTFEATVDYEPGESTTALFGGNSNWRGPVWMPVNYLLVEALRRFASFYGDDFTVEFPTGSGVQLTLAAVADRVTDRLCAIFLCGADGHRPVLGERDLFASPAWRGLIPFHEYFHGESGQGLGASHQTGWTGLIADLIITRRRAVSADSPP